MKKDYDSTKIYRKTQKKGASQTYDTPSSDGRNYKVLYYSLEMILAIGYRVRGVRGVQFRQWATQHLSEYRHYCQELLGER